MIEQKQVIELINSIDWINALKPKLTEQIIDLVFDDTDIKQAIKAQILNVINNDLETLKPLILNEFKAYLEYNLMDLVNPSDIKTLIMGLVESKLGGKNE